MTRLDTDALDKLQFKQIFKGDTPTHRIEFPVGTSVEMVEWIATLPNKQAENPTPLGSIDIHSGHSSIPAMWMNARNAEAVLS